MFMPLDSGSFSAKCMIIYFLDFRHYFSIDLYCDNTLHKKKKGSATIFSLEINEGVVKSVVSLIFHGDLHISWNFSIRSNLMEEKHRFFP